jgi:Tol biopolymer transport system component/predicted Ser/Thr protein kinase
MLLQTGARLGPYEILDLLGEGGMGEVWRARDTRLDRTVAIKKSALRFTDRFEREARSIAALNHPHICTLYDVGPDYLVMEYVEGRPLKGPMPLQTALCLGAQIADALYAAHVHGIVHRDLKPDNILLTKSGVKLLDFGLAKADASQVAVDGRTLTMAMTGEGTIVGTPQYMAPEQVEGKQADARSDIFSFGSVLYELITGRQAFRGRSAASVIAAILTAEPPELAEIRTPALVRVLRVCLAKDPEERWQSARELKHALKWAADTAPSRPVPVGWITAAAVSVLAALALAVLLLRVPTPRTSLVRFSIASPEKTMVAPPQGPAISPDGERLVFSAARADGHSMLWIRPLDSVQPQAIAGTEEGQLPFWSPDSRSIGFSASGQLKRVDLASGAIRVLCPAPRLAAGCWSREGLILFGGEDRAIQCVPAQGGEARAVSRLDGETNHVSPQFLPDQRHFVFLASRGRWRIGSLDGGPESALPIKAGPPVYASGYLLFISDGDILAQRFDSKRAQLTGDAVIVGGPVQQFTNTPFYSFSASQTGVLAWLNAASRNSTQLVWMDAAGNRLGTVGEPADYSSPALSPDGGRLAVAIRDPATRQRDIWIFDLARGSRMRFTFDPADDLNPVWSPDGSRIAWTSDRKGVRNLYVKFAAGTGEDQLLYESPQRKSVEQWSPDGRYLLFNDQRSGGGTEIMALPLAAGAERKPITLVEGRFNYQRAQLSPDGKFLVYRSTESGVEGIFVQPFPPSGAKWQVSDSNASEAFWGEDGKQLFYVSGSKLMVVPVETYDGRFEVGVSKPLLDLQLPDDPARNRIVGVGNGRRFLVNVSASSEKGNMTVLLNWLSPLKR